MRGVNIACIGLVPVISRVGRGGQPPLSQAYQRFNAKIRLKADCGAAFGAASRNERLRACTHKRGLLTECPLLGRTGQARTAEMTRMPQSAHRPTENPAVLQSPGP